MTNVGSRQQKKLSLTLFSALYSTDSRSRSLQLPIATMGEGRGVQHAVCFTRIQVQYNVLLQQYHIEQYLLLTFKLLRAVQRSALKAITTIVLNYEAVFIIKVRANKRQYVVRKTIEKTIPAWFLTQALYDRSCVPNSTNRSLYVLLYMIYFMKMLFVFYHMSMRYVMVHSVLKKEPGRNTYHYAARRYGVCLVVKQ